MLCRYFPFDTKYAGLKMDFRTDLMINNKNTLKSDTQELLEAALGLLICEIAAEGTFLNQRTLVNGGTMMVKTSKMLKQIEEPS